MDECDMAEPEIAVFRKAAIARRLKLQKKENQESLKECVDCGEKIPEARRKAMPGCIRCVECEALIEEMKNG